MNSELIEKTTISETVNDTGDAETNHNSRKLQGHNLSIFKDPQLPFADWYFVRALFHTAFDN